MPNDSRSSRFMCSEGHNGPSTDRNLTSVSIGVGCGASVTRGSDVSDARAVATTAVYTGLLTQAAGLAEAASRRRRAAGMLRMLLAGFAGYWRAYARCSLAND